MRIIDSHEVAPLTEKIIIQLKAMHPSRTETVKMPPEEKVKEELRQNKTEVAIFSKSFTENTEREKINPRQSTDIMAEKAADDEEIEAESDTQKDQRWRLERSARTQGNAENIVRVAGLKKSSTRGEVQCIIPNLAKLIAVLSNRIANGDFSVVIGRITCVAWTVALWKNAEKTKVRPISCGGALRKLIVKAHCDQVREELVAHVGNSQLGVMKGGFETGVHAMRALSKQCRRDGNVILLIDFANAFNACNRNLLIKLVSTHIPKVATLAFWLYAEQAELHLDNGDTLVSSEGGQQGCGLMNLLFALLMKWILRQVQKEGVNVK